MKAYHKKDLHRSKDPDRMTQAVAVVAAYQAIEETAGTNARLKAQAITDTGAILYALVPVHIGQQCVEKWHALQQRWRRGTMKRNRSTCTRPGNNQYTTKSTTKPRTTQAPADTHRTKKPTLWVYHR